MCSSGKELEVDETHRKIGMMPWARTSSIFRLGAAHSQRARTGRLLHSTTTASKQKKQQAL